MPPLARALLDMLHAMTAINPTDADAPDAGTGKADTTERDGALALNDMDPETVEETSGVVAFLGLFVSIFQRISVSIVVQLLAANVRTQQPLRAVRVLTLLSVAVFFLFLEATGKVGRVKRLA